MLREGLQSADIDSRPDGSPGLGETLALHSPTLQATVPDLEFAHTVLVIGCEPLDDAPILDLRIRKGVRRNGVKLAVASARPSALDRNATLVARYPPGNEEAFLASLATAVANGTDDDGSGLARLLREGGEDVVILWGERLGASARHLVSIASSLGLERRDGAGLLYVPVNANGRGQLEAGAVPFAGPGFTVPDGFVAGRDAAGIAEATADGSIHALYLLDTDPIRDRPNRALWERALHAAGLVVAHASVLTEGIAEHADVIFPAESSAEQNGTVVHPDGRIQRLRAAIGHPGTVHPNWSVIADVAEACGLDLGVISSSVAFAQLAEAVPFYRGLTLEGIGGLGVRWPALAGATAFPTQAASAPTSLAPETGPSAQHGSTDGALRLGTYRPIWASPEVEISPSLQFLVPHQQVELAPEDAARLELADGEEVEVSQNGTRLRAKVALRERVPAGTAFLAEGIASDSANVLTEPTVLVGKFSPEPEDIPVAEDEQLIIEEDES